MTAPDAYWEEAHAAFHRLADADARIWVEAEAGSEPEPELDAEAEAEWADEWDSEDSHAYMDRVEAGLEPEAEPW